MYTLVQFLPTLLFSSADLTYLTSPNNNNWYSKLVLMTKSTNPLALALLYAIHAFQQQFFYRYFLQAIHRVLPNFRRSIVKTSMM